MDFVCGGGGREERLNAYLDALTAVLGHADRAAPFQSYCIGLLLPGERKSIEPMAARVEPERVRATHQSLHHLVAKADWSDAAMLGCGAPPSAGSHRTARRDQRLDYR